MIIPTGVAGGGGGSLWQSLHSNACLFFWEGGGGGGCMPVESVSITMNIMAISAMNRYCQAKKREKLE